MFLRQFPNLRWIQEQSRTNFKNQIGEGNIRLKEMGWPNVVLSTRSNKTERNGIKAPFSLFTNLSGKSMVKAEGKVISVSPDTFCLVNKGDTYDLNIIENDTVTFNIHFGDELYNETHHTITSTHYHLLENTLAAAPSNYISCSHWKDDQIELQIRKIKNFYTQHAEVDFERENEILSEVLTLILIKCGESTSGLERIDVQRATTKAELVRRVSLARNYLHDCYKNHITVEELAGIAMMSKFHFLRVFKEVFGATPHQYLLNIRLQKAEKLLKSNLPIHQIALAIGFEEINSFYQFYKKKRGITPSQFRSHN